RRQTSRSTAQGPRSFRLMTVTRSVAVSKKLIDVCRELTLSGPGLSRCFLTGRRSGVGGGVITGR
ncbi:hypothetical protein ACIOC1_33955, partial [Streptomyces sp. NPDC088197]|uniref:hypothetical protein n=1 Tax=Streptomyces sp. NPDC088197 TaxID=3365840 RepID=UPI00382D54DC